MGSICKAQKKYLSQWPAPLSAALHVAATPSKAIHKRRIGAVN